ncbi:hypothetical protein [Listeria welshimeri]|uniref:hypothetical protein n=1 Tax=Listeria welshimeri TaxID=1643 RepID=UPI001627AC1F|nr:hypothetical protein [Listeria welshimeri]MBC1342345.1 hypothetical protein [Listeria welshimeri]MBC1350702.1 hypothetical protein [Listeria welshimeri]MBF2342534.1 hypothetical protein [Listeria welshimeri]
MAEKSISKLKKELDLEIKKVAEKIGKDIIRKTNIDSFEDYKRKFTPEIIDLINSNFDSKVDK